MNVELCDPMSDGVSAEIEENNVSAKKCLFTRKGVCQEHQVPGKKLPIPSKVWKDRGGCRGFGYVTKKSTRYICMVGKNARRELNISTEDVINISNAGLSRNSVLGADGNLDQGDYVEYSRTIGISEKKRD